MITQLIKIVFFLSDFSWFLMDYIVQITQVLKGYATWFAFPVVFFFTLFPIIISCLFSLSSGKCECRTGVRNSKAFCGMKYSYGESEVHGGFHGSIQTTCTKSFEGNEGLVYDILLNQSITLYVTVVNTVFWLLDLDFPNRDGFECLSESRRL